MVTVKTDVLISLRSTFYAWTIRRKFFFTEFKPILWSYYKTNLASTSSKQSVHWLASTYHAIEIFFYYFLYWAQTRCSFPSKCFWFEMPKLYSNSNSKQFSTKAKISSAKSVSIYTHLLSSKDIRWRFSLNFLPSFYITFSALNDFLETNFCLKI